METTYAWITEAQRKIADSTYWDLGRHGKELRIHTETRTSAKPEVNAKRKHSAILRISAGRRFGDVHLELTVWVGGGSDNPERTMTNSQVASMLGVPGYDLGKDHPSLQKYPGATHYVPRRFIRDGTYFKFLGVAFQIRPGMIQCFEHFLRTGTFR